jgi:predicted PurR-regulated permease PerM
MTRSNKGMDPNTFARAQRVFLLLLALAISALFFGVVKSFLISILMAAIFAGMTHPLYLWLVRKTRGREAASAVGTVLAILFLIVGPAIFFVGILANEALEVSESAGPWIQSQMTNPTELEGWLDQRARDLPLVGDLLPEPDEIVRKLGEIAGRTGGFLVARLADATRGTVTFIFHLFIMLYAIYFFLRSGRVALERIMYLVPLESDQETRLVARFVSVTRATLKGTLVIGIIQGTLAGAAFAVAGIASPIFWGTIMAVLSIIPAVGAALVWIPAVIYLFATGQTLAGIGLLLWCGIVVGSSDNVLRPILVGKDTKMPDLLVLLSTLGGIGVYGALGVIIGPIIAALFLTVWELYGEAFKDVLPKVKEAV